MNDVCDTLTFLPGEKKLKNSKQDGKTKPDSLAGEGKETLKMFSVDKNHDGDILNRVCLFHGLPVG